MKFTHQDIDEIRAAMAERHSKLEHDVVTPEVVKQRIRHYMELAKDELRKCEPDEGSNTGFVPTATIIMPDGLEANPRLPWRNVSEKRDMMYRLSQTCGVMGVAACLIRVVGTGADMEKVAAGLHLNLPDPTDRAKVDYFEKRMYEWIKKNTGGNHLADLPAEYRFDWLVVHGIGPRIPECGAAEKYEWRDGKLRFEKLFGPDDPVGMTIDMFPRWWD